MHLLLKYAGASAAVGSMCGSWQLMQRSCLSAGFCALQKALVLRLINAKEYPQAEADMEKYVEEFPEDDFMRKMLSIAKSQ